MSRATRRLSIGLAATALTAGLAAAPATAALDSPVEGC